MLRTNIEFSCDMPYDAVEGEGGEFIEMPARTVAQAMADILADLGCAVEAVQSAGDHGWFFRFKSKSADVSCEVTAIDGVVAQFDGPDGHKPWFGEARPPSPDYVEILDRFGRAIDGDPRFRDLGWFSSEELTGQQRGARTPTGAYDPTPCRRTFGAPGNGGQAGGPSLSARTCAVSGAVDVTLDQGWALASPMRRLAARMFDHFVIVGGALLLAISLLRIPPPLPATTTVDYNGYLLLFSIAVGGGVMNALLVPRISTTPGKWLCNVRVVRTGDEAPLSGAAALKREVEVIVAGCAMFIPLLMPFTIAFSLIRWMYFGATGWDRRRGSLVLQAPTSLRAFAATGISLLSSFTVFWLLLETWSPQ